MKLEPIIVSLLDTDLYKFNMDQVIFHKHTDLCGQYYFKCRNENIVFTGEMVKEINEQVDHLCSLRFSKKELDYLRSIRFIKDDYVEFLRLWHPIRDYVRIALKENGELSVEINGPLFSAMQFEIYLLEIINETYFRMAYDYEKLKASAAARLDEKIKAMNDGTYTFKFAEFGCRRRLSREWQDEVIYRLITETDKCVGTSNVYLAMKYNITPVGTYAHEFVQMYQGIDSIPLAYTNYYAMKDWYNEYNGDNGTALTDTVCRLIRYNDVPIDHTDMVGLKRLASKIGIKTLKDVIKLKRADVLAEDPRHYYRLNELNAAYDALCEIEENGVALQVRDLAVGGNDLIGIGIRPGPAIGKLLRAALDAVISGDVDNEKGPLLRFISGKAAEFE